MHASSLYLVQFGRPGFLGRFRSLLALARGDRIVIRGPRGVEIGEVLVAADPRVIRIDPSREHIQEDGEILRLADAEDEAKQELLARRGHEVLELASARAEAAGLPLAFVDVEVLLDGTAILHALPWDECNATPMLDEVSAAVGLTVRLLDLSRSPKTVAEHGCGKPGCGSEAGGCSSCGTGGGCSTGSCSRGSVKSPDELTAYFADLRRQMEAEGAVRMPLN